MEKCIGILYKIVKIEKELGKKSRMGPVLAEITMKSWEEEQVERKGRMRKFRIYV